MTQKTGFSFRRYLGTSRVTDTYTRTHTHIHTYTHTYTYTHTHTSLCPRVRHVALALLVAHPLRALALSGAVLRLRLRRLACVSVPSEPGISPPKVLKPTTGVTLFERERERDRERQTDRQRERERERAHERESKRETERGRERMGERA